MTRLFARLLLGAHTRRAITVPSYMVVFMVATLAAPLVLPATAVVDLVARRKLTVVRAMVIAWVYLFVEFVGLLAVFYMSAQRFRWSNERWIAAHQRLEGWWAGVQFNWARRVYGLRVTVTGEEALANGPYLLFMRHVSVLDNLIPAVFVVERHGVPMKWVLNYYLMRDPCIDIVGHRLGCVFVRGGTEQSSREVHRIRQAAEELRPDEGVVIYPEGTLFSPAKHERVVSRLERGRDTEMYEFARSLKNTMPPRLGGTMALLDARPDMDVVFCSHAGLEDALDKVSIVAGGLIGRELRIKFWRVPASEIPRERGAMRTWLFQEWKKVDDFVTGPNLGAPGA